MYNELIDLLNVFDLYALQFAERTQSMTEEKGIFFAAKYKTGYVFMKINEDI